MYQSKELYYIPECLLDSSDLLEYFLDKDLDYYEFTEKAWNNKNVDSFFSKDDIDYIPKGLQRSSLVLERILKSRKFELVVYFKNDAWNENLVDEYFILVSNDDFELPEELLNNDLVVNNILRKGLTIQYRDFFCLVGRKKCVFHQWGNKNGGKP